MLKDKILMEYTLKSRSFYTKTSGSTFDNIRSAQIPDDLKSEEK